MASVNVNTRETSADDLNFSSSPLFIQSQTITAAHPETEVIEGRVVRLEADTKVHLPGEEDIDGKKGDVLFKSNSADIVVHFIKEDFVTLFDRVLANGMRVSLSESPAVQFVKITEAHDDIHLIDLTQMIGKTALQETARLAGVGVERANKLVSDAMTRLAETEEGKIFITAAQQAGSDIQAGAKEVMDRARALLDSPQGQQARQTLSGIRGQLGRIVGGGHEQDPK